MTTHSPGARAIASYEISDVFLIESHCWVAREINQSEQISNVTYGHQASVAPECLIQTRTPLEGGDPVYILRYFINGEVRLLKPEMAVTEAQELSDQHSLAVLRFVFAADYICPTQALEDRDAMSAFGRNAYFHTWPYLRAEVHSACSRLRIPQITLPMLKPDQVAMTKDTEKLSSKQD